MYSRGLNFSKVVAREAVRLIIIWVMVSICSILFEIFGRMISTGCQFCWGLRKNNTSLDFLVEFLEIRCPPSYIHRTIHGVPGEQNFYTVVFAVSRTMGVMAQYIWSRAAPWRLRRCGATVYLKYYVL